MTEQKKVLSVGKPGRPHWVGDGFPVRTVFAAHGGNGVDPFLMLDYAGPAEFEPSDRPRGVEQHPHKGFETVTIAYQGSVDHRDSAGNAGTIFPGDVQWMTAGAGVLHEEMHGKEFTAQGGVFEMAQLWVNLPAADKLVKPGYQAITSSEIPRVDLGRAAFARVIAGEVNGVKGPAKTFTPISVLDLRLEGGGEGELRLPEGHNTALVLLRGTLKVNGDTVLNEPGHMARLSASGSSVLLSATEETLVLGLSGEPIGEPVVAYGPFVMNTEAEIREAFEEFRAGKLGQLQ